MTILPTHTCFDDALDWIVEQFKQDAKSASALLLVHGIQIIPTGDEVGHPFAHAWVEDGIHCWDFGIIEGGPHHGEKCAYAIKTAEYYNERQVKEATRYTVQEAWMENRRSGHFGPWKPEYEALCGRAVTVMGLMTAELSIQ